MAALAILTKLISLVCVFLLINGAEATPIKKLSIDNVPYLGTLRDALKESTRASSGFLCVATIIHNRVLVTPAVCIYGQRRQDLVVVVGNTFIRGVSPTMKVLAIETWRWHARYRFGEMAYNIGLVFTARDITPKHGVIAYAAINRSKLIPHTECLFLGWSRTSVNSKLMMNPPIAFFAWNTFNIDCYKITSTAGVMCSYVPHMKEFKNKTEDLGNPIICNGKLSGVFLERRGEISTYIDIYSFRKWINGAIYIHFHSATSPLRSICCRWLFVLAISIFFIFS
ncbi:uncharacterized protein LOC26528507 [Drosophila mojavensis]|uniref:Peptidase S1 domain-containing protein n=1 Tax=Drosophila mojavensis TaxID=7230 RepID=A0A0Q9X8F1_DROMO|nr:uncharacterized protein LOC26528507 [Drosophila mojavensis]KRG03609.1 uncharacterized protein Dmoj_GI26866 [Drosophila mojavensis]